LAANEIVTIDTIGGIENTVGVETILRTQTSHDQIAVAIFSRIVGVLTVFAVGIMDGTFGHRSIQYIKLREK